MARRPQKPEVKSPAGHWPQLKAAIEAGADGVYFGLTHFTARAKAGFMLKELPDVLSTLHSRGVYGYVTFNTLIFEHELAEAARVIGAIAEAGADGIIVQDYAAVRLIREIAPDMPVHGSTQMSITDARGVELARSSGVSRVTLARELSLDEIRAVAAQTDGELEVFVHGALCVAYSGQCFSSEAWGGRSANRGQCAQACRLPYELIVDGRVKPLGDARYLLSPGDLYALRQIPEIISAGVTALKIEGRYKDAEYVAMATRAYRKAVDEAWAGRELSIPKEEELQIEQVYSRGLGPHFLTGTNHQAVVRGRAPRHRGVHMGTVKRVEAGRVVIEAASTHRVAPLKPGDGVVFDSADWRSPEEHEQGGRVYSVEALKNGRLAISFAAGAIQFDEIRPGDLLWRTHDPDLDRLTRPYTEATAPVAKQEVSVVVRAREGEPLTTEWILEKDPNARVRVAAPVALRAAKNRGISKEMLCDQFGRLGNTPYKLISIQLDLAGNPFTPVSLLNQIRRDAVEQLQQLQRRSPRGPVTDPQRALDHVRRSASEIIRHIEPAAGPAPAHSELHLLVRTPEQLDAALELRPATVTLDYLDLYGLRPSIQRVKNAGIAVRVASPRILKPAETKIADFLVSLHCPIIVRSTGLLNALRRMKHPPLIGDFSLNIANTISAGLLIEQGLVRITPTHDLNAAQVTDLVRRTGPDRVEVIAYQHLPVFHTEHCVFCRFLSHGTSYRDCGRPCEKHRVALRDARGREHPVLADVGCRNTVFGAEAQQASGHFDEWKSAGVRHWRLEFAHESASQVRNVARAFAAALSGAMSARELASELAKAAPEGITEGSLYVPADYLQLPILQ